MKKITFLITLAALLSTGAANASDFGLERLSVEDIRASQTEFRAPAPQQKAEQLIGVDMNIRIPYATFKQGVEAVAASEKRLTILDKNAPVAFKAGEFLKLSNIQINQGGIIITPTLTLKPYFVGTDKLAIRVQRIQLHALMEPSVKAAPLPTVNQEEIMVQVMEVITKGVYSAVNDFLKARNIQMKAEDVIKLKYDKAAWTLHAQMSSRIMGHFVPAGLMGELHLTGFSFNDKGLVLTLQTAE